MGDREEKLYHADVHDVLARRLWLCLCGETLRLMPESNNNLLIEDAGVFRLAHDCLGSKLLMLAKR